MLNIPMTFSVFPDHDFFWPRPWWHIHSKACGVFLTATFFGFWGLETILAVDDVTLLTACFLAGGCIVLDNGVYPIEKEEDDGDEVNGVITGIVATNSEALVLELNNVLLTFKVGVSSESIVKSIQSSFFFAVEIFEELLLFIIGIILSVIETMGFVWQDWFKSIF